MLSENKRQVHPVVQQLRKTRIALGMSLEELGERSGYSGCHIWSMEHGKINAKIAMVSDIAETLGMKIALVPK